MTSASTRPTTSPATRPPADHFPNPNADRPCPRARRVERIVAANRDTVVVVDERPMSTSAPSRSRRWSNATTTCWWSRPCPSRARLPACASVSRWAAGRSSTAWSGSRTASTPIHRPARVGRRAGRHAGPGVLRPDAPGRDGHARAHERRSAGAGVRRAALGGQFRVRAPPGA